MGPHIDELIFPAKVPSMVELVAEAERLGGMKLTLTHPEGDGELFFVAFSEFPKNRIHVTLNRPELVEQFFPPGYEFLKNHLRLGGTKPGFLVRDDDHRTPALFALLMQAGASLGGQPERYVLLNCRYQLPLDKDAVGKEIKEIRRISTTFSLVVLAVLLMVLIAVVAIVGGTVWLVWSFVSHIFQ